MIELSVTLEQLITTVKQLQPCDRAKVAKALIDVELKSELADLIRELYNQNPVVEVTDSDIMQEIKAMRDRTRNQR